MQLPKMPEQEVRRLQKLVRSDKPEDWASAVRFLGEADAYQDVPGWVRLALRPSIGIDSIMIGVRILWEFHERFGIDQRLPQQELRKLLLPLHDHDLRGNFQLRRWIFADATGKAKADKWISDVLLGLFDPSLMSWSYEACLDNYLAWFGEVASRLSTEERQRVARRLVDVLFSPPEYWYLLSEPWEEKVPSNIRWYIAVTLSNFWNEAASSVLEHIGHIGSDDEKPNGFWAATQWLCETVVKNKLTDPLLADFLVKRLGDVNRRQLIGEQGEIADSVVEALIELRDHFQPEAVSELVKAYGHFEIEVRWLAQRVLEGINPEVVISAIGRVATLLREPASQRTGWERDSEIRKVKEAAVEVLGMMRRNGTVIDEAVDVLGQQLSVEPLLSVRSKILETLERSQNPRAQTFLGKRA